MKKLFLLIAPMLLSFYASTQKADIRLFKSYTQQELQEMRLNDPESIVILNYALDNACYITDIPPGKTVSAESAVVISDLSIKVCFAEHGLRIQDTNQYLPIKGTTKMLVVKSTFVLKNELKYRIKQ